MFLHVDLCGYLKSMLLVHLYQLSVFMLWDIFHFKSGFAVRGNVVAR